MWLIRLWFNEYQLKFNAFSLQSDNNISAIDICFHHFFPLFVRVIYLAFPFRFSKMYTRHFHWNFQLSFVTYVYLLNLKSTIVTIIISLRMITYPFKDILQTKIRIYTRTPPYDERLSGNSTLCLKYQYKCDKYVK